MRSAIEQSLSLPGAEALAALTTAPEDQWFDRKSGRIQARDLAAPLVALANAEGGYLVVGISEGVVDGVTARRANEIRQAAHNFTDPPVALTVFEIAAHDDTTVLVLRVEAGDGVHATTTGHVYLRVGDTSRRLTFAQERELRFDRGETTFDSRPVTARADELDDRACADYRDTIGSSSVTDMLNARGLLTHDGRPTVAAWLLFADRPGAIFPSAHVRVLKYADRERGTGERMTLMAGHDVRFDGPLPSQYREAEETIRAWIPTLQRLGPDGRFRDQPIIPEAAWKEGVINAIVHRSYSMQGDHIRVELFPNRIEITNPGRFPGIAELHDPTAVIRVARNPRIARVLAEMGIARELGEGIRRMFATMRAAGLADPVYRQSASGVTLTLLDQPVAAGVLDGLPKTARRLLEVLQEAGRPVGTMEAAEAVGVARPTAIRHLKLLQANRLVTWSGGGFSDPTATWAVR